LLLTYRNWISNRPFGKTHFVTSVEVAMTKQMHIIERWVGTLAAR